MVAIVGSIAAELLLDRSKFDQGLGRAGLSVRRFENETGSALGRVDRGFSATFGNIARGAGSAAMALGRAGLAGAVASLTGGALFATLKETARALADIGDQAKQAGIQVEAFQELAAVARANRLEVDDLAAAMRELQLRADEFVVSAGKSGSAAEAFQRIGFTVETLREKLKDPSALLSEIIGKVQQLDRAAQIRVFDELFGGDGERLIRLLDQGEEGIQRIVEHARTAGQVFDQDLVQRAGELDSAISSAAATVSSELQGAIINAGWQLYNFIQQFQAFENRTTQSLDQSMRALGKERLDLENQILQIQSDQAKAGGVNAMIAESRINDAKARLQALADEERQILDILERRRPPKIAAPTMDMPGLMPSWADFQSEFAPPRSSGGGGRSSATTATNDQADATQNLVARLREELSAIGANNVERRIANELRAAGVTLDSAAGQEIASLVQAIESETIAYQSLQDAVATASGLTKDFVGGLINDMRQGVSGAEALSNAFGRLGDRLLDMALDQAINGLFANLLGAGAGSFGANSQTLEIAA